jgi:hypothetical protein
MQRSRRILVLAGLGLLAGGKPAGADDGADRRAIQRIISGQIEAFRRDDGPGAFSFASPGIRQMFQTEARFMAMVREGYPQVYRPRSFAFGEYRVTDAGPSQLVEIVDGEGQVWRALYTLEKQPDGTWRISGCYVLKAPQLAS